MKQAVIAVRKKAKFSTVEQALAKESFTVQWVDSGKTALDCFSDKTKRIDLFVCDHDLGDMQAKNLVAKVVMKSPTTNCAAASPLSPEEFHDAFEGLGVFAHLPLEPCREDSEKMVAALKKILGMTQ